MNSSCTHCGQPVPETLLKPDGPSFCCSGCETVYAFLNSQGLSHYYELKKTLPSFSSYTPDSGASTSFYYLDDLTYTPRVVFYLEGVHCVACLWLVEKIPQLLKGVQSAQLTLGKNTATFLVDDTLKLSELAQLLLDLGYRPHLVENSDQATRLQTKEDRKLLIQLGLAAGIAGNIMIFSVSLYTGASGHLAEYFRWVCFFMNLPIVLYCALPFYKSSWGALRIKSISMDVPVSAAIILGTLASTWNLLTGSIHIYFDSIAMLVFLLLSTRYLLRRITHFAVDSSQLVHYLLPKFAKKLISNSQSETEVLSESLLPGDRIRVHPGQPLPVDGQVIAGKSWVNLSALTGESHPQPVQAESRVYSGTFNGEGILDISVSHTGTQTRLGKLLLEIESRSKPHLVTIADKMAKYLLIGVGVISLGIIGLLSALGHPGEGFNRALALLVVTCPCALAIATPLSFSIALKKAAQRGILIKNTDCLEKCAQIDTLIFDKTGTLTFGNLDVLSWETDTTTTQDDAQVKAIVYALEASSFHPVALAIRRYLSAYKNSHVLIQDFQEVIGLGVKGVVEGHLFEAIKGDSGIDIKRDGQRVAILTVGDQLRPDAAPILKKLTQQDYTLALASGDHQSAVELIASQLPFNPSLVFANTSPEQKQQLVQQYPNSLMVGDGANDAAALSQAAIGIAVQGSLEVSLRAADVYMMAPGITPIYEFLSIGKSTLRLVKINLGLSMVYNLIFASLAITGILTPLAAAIAMPVSSLIVLLVSLVGFRSTP